MSYQVLARKWRPQRFADVLGQEHITRTLQNAIKNQRVGHAYLFVGSRGIGKTTSARIFAKALNCGSPQTDSDGFVEPCCECESCREIAAGNCLDVIEIDGASHNKVEDVRELCENVQYTPTNGRQYKIYIIDEVHMLTTQAWNALLKTLEEPPPHAKFLFATTESHKVLPTILSRTQRFDLRRIPPPIIVDRLRWIADKESVFIDDGALNIIARAAEGGMRDAQSIFDQMIAFCGGMSEDNKITENDVIEVFGMVSQDELKHIQRAMLTNTPEGLVEAIHNLAEKGRDLEKLYGDILQGLRNIMLYQVAKDPSRILEISASELEDVKALADIAKPQIAQRLVEGMLSYGDQIRHTLNKRVFIEVTLLKILQDAHAVQVDDLISVLRKWNESGEAPELPPVSNEKKKSNLTTQLAVTEEPPKAEAPEAPAPSPSTFPDSDDRADEPMSDAPQATPSQVEHIIDEPESTIQETPSPEVSEAESTTQETPSPEVSEPPAPVRTESTIPTAPSMPSDYEAEPPDELDIPESMPATRATAEGPKYRRGPEILERVQNNPFVQKVIEEFDGKVVDACTKADEQNN